MMDLKSWICDNTFLEGDIKVRDHCHVTGKGKGAVHRDRNINVSLNYKIPSCLTIQKIMMNMLLCKNLEK